MKYPDKNIKAEKFTAEMLPQVSRTFNLAIKFLPKELSRSVGLAYLLCRIADTYEDSDILNPSERQEMLLNYAALLDDCNHYDKDLVNSLENAFVDCSQPRQPDSNQATAKNLQSADDLPSIRLVENLNLVLSSVNTLPANHKKHIFNRAQEMAKGMANYTMLASGRESNVCFLKDEADWDNYCYYVAGTVGHMLTDIFSDYAGFSDTAREKLHIFGRSFGIGLQKVNVLKDAVVDTKRGICFLPQTFIDRYGVSFPQLSGTGSKGDLSGLVSAVVDVCRNHFQDSLEYIKIIPHKQLGLRMFLIVPVMLAAATMRLFSDYPQHLLEKGDIKLTRKDVWRLVRRSFYCKFSNRLLTYSFGKIYPG
ncbi:MAG: squalene/phytoene synthase family protein [candidate division Zixibacteria bacterium]|nr:squalene/phytoene synthase family protein [candidate division Zixibacteria bacterium]